MKDNAHVAQGFNVSPETYVQLKEAYDRAVLNKEQVFVFRNRYVLVDYAKYMLEYLETSLGIQQA